MNPWTKKNPFMSMWLSGAHKVGGAARSQAAAAIGREMKSASANTAAEANRQVVDFWRAALGTVPPSTRRKKR